MRLDETAAWLGDIDAWPEAIDAHPEATGLDRDDLRTRPGETSARLGEPPSKRVRT